MVNTSIHPDTQTHEEGGIWGACAGVITMNSIMRICADIRILGPQRVQIWCSRVPIGVDLDPGIPRTTRYRDIHGHPDDPIHASMHPDHPK
jgi:hypothetical protein